MWLYHMTLQEAEIKKAAKRGDKQTAAVYAKQLVRLRQQKTKSMGLSAQITATGHQMTVRFGVGVGIHAVCSPQNFLKV